MSNPVTATPMPGRTGPPWTAEGTVYFYGGPLSNFAPTPGLRLPRGYHGHHERDRVAVASTEHWFQACKATSRGQFDVILASGSPVIAKRAGRQTELRADWEQVKLQVMLAACAVSSPWSPTGRRCCSRTRARSQRTAPRTSSGAAVTPRAATRARTCSASR
jgi:hypothetical protein